MAHRTTLDVRFNELDPYGHVNHSVYVTYCEVGRTDALTACGIPLQAMADQGFQLVVTRIDVRYRGAATAGDTLVVETAIGSQMSTVVPGPVGVTVGEGNGGSVVAAEGAGPPSVVE